MCNGRSVGSPACSPYVRNYRRSPPKLFIYRCSKYEQRGTADVAARLVAVQTLSDGGSNFGKCGPVDGAGFEASWVVDMIGWTRTFENRVSAARVNTQFGTRVASTSRARYRHATMSVNRKVAPLTQHAGTSAVSHFVRNYLSRFDGLTDRRTNGRGRAVDLRESLNGKTVRPYVKRTSAHMILTIRRTVFLSYAQRLALAGRRSSNDDA